MVITDFRISFDTDTSIHFDMGTMEDTVVIFNNEYIEPVVIPKKKDPFWSKQGKNKKGGKCRYVCNNRI